MQIHPLGKQGVKKDKRTLKLRDYLKPVLPAPPAEVSWVTHVTDWGMMLNDQLGDCTIAAAGHMVQQWTKYAGTEVIIPDAEILSAYEALSGYVPGQPNTDNGCVMLDVLNYWRLTGIGGHRIMAFMGVNFADRAEVRTAIELFGNVYIGIQLPLSAQGEDAWTVQVGGVYTDSGEPGGWGGHAVPIDAASPLTLTCITWGERLKMSWNFFEDYTDEAYVVLSKDWLEQSGVTPGNFNLTQLQNDLNAFDAVKAF